MKNNIINNPFYKKKVCIIGSINELQIVDVIKMLHLIGCKEQNSVSKATDYIVVGDYDSDVKFNITNLSKVDELLSKGILIKKITAEKFKDMLFEYCDLSQIISTQDILNKIQKCLSSRYKKCVNFTLTESKNIYTFLQASAKETPWHPELTGKTILQIGVEDVLLPASCKSSLNEFNINYTYDYKSNFCHINSENFLKIDNPVLNEIIIDTLTKSFAFKTFGCCSKYSECNSKMTCCHEDALYSNSCQLKKFIDAQRKIRKKYGLPTTIELKYYDRQYNIHKVLELKIIKKFESSCVFRIRLENDKTVNILSDYLVEMQKSNFIETHKI